MTLTEDDVASGRCGLKAALYAQHLEHPRAVCKLASSALANLKPLSSALRKAGFLEGAGLWLAEVYIGRIWTALGIVPLYCMIPLWCDIIIINMDKVDHGDDDSGSKLLCMILPLNIATWCRMFFGCALSLFQWYSASIAWSDLECHNWSDIQSSNLQLPSCHLFFFKDILSTSSNQLETKAKLEETGIFLVMSYELLLGSKKINGGGQLRRKLEKKLKVLKKAFKDAGCCWLGAVI